MVWRVARGKWRVASAWRATARNVHTCNAIAAHLQPPPQLYIRVWRAIRQHVAEGGVGEELVERLQQQLKQSSKPGNRQVTAKVTAR